jgi:FKBP-type peptidyl-prolyl cis-trans isomerase FkpA
MPLYIRVMETPVPYDISELWTKLHTGDSVVATQLLDTFIKRNPANIPPQYKNGDQIKYYIKIIDVFTSDSAAQADEKKTKESILKEEVASMEKYLNSKNIKAIKTTSGAFIQIANPGTGAQVDTGKYVSVRYKGTAFDSHKVFDSNMDTTSGGKPLLSFTIGSGEMIRGFDEGLRSLKVGGSGTIYIPSLLAFGATPGTENIKPFEAVIFDVTVVSLQDKAPVQPMQLPQQQAQQMPPHN